ncbi:hypothetical protein IGI04_036717 [Brassica rapa subsp. trilocularis]|uniref:Uncharacterized protein n=1 Tax=Brassica rapa subsp. trilocularis TaxID=1813537 RepID=A0ABQ7LF87_BRACM|nr:hypothetical protein IGI04_036717 [Brassica rapa subsp. trilocularis]
MGSIKHSIKLRYFSKIFSVQEYGMIFSRDFLEGTRSILRSMIVLQQERFMRSNYEGYEYPMKSTTATC